MAGCHCKDTAECGQSSLSSNDSCTVTCYDGSPDFCTKFGLDVSEQPLVGWLSGKKCTLVDRERPLIGSKGGTLYLTRRYVALAVPFIRTFGNITFAYTLLSRATPPCIAPINTCVYSCLCFESKSSEKVVIQLADIISANKVSTTSCRGRGWLIGAQCVAHVARMVPHFLLKT